MADAARVIVRSETLRDDAFTAERARVAEDAGAVAGEMLIERDTVADAAEEISERRLAVFERLPPKIGAV